MRIEHTPYGIDDPYKRLATERFPRDPVDTDPVQITFRANGATEAWLTLHAEPKDAEHRFSVQRLGEGLWTAQLPPLAAGNYSYQLHALGAEETVSSDLFPLAVATWHTVVSVADSAVLDTGLRLTLQDDQEQLSTLLLTFTGASLALDFYPLELILAAGEQPCQVTQTETGFMLSAGHLQAEVDSKALRVSLTGGATFDTSLAYAFKVAGKTLQVKTMYALQPFEALYGLGERFTPGGLRGAEWDVRVYEEYKEQHVRSYMPIPFFVSQYAWAVWLESDAPSYLDARADSAMLTADVGQKRIRHHLFVADTPYALTQQFTQLSGAIATVPDWVFGPWMSANTWNSQARAEEAVNRSLAEDVPATVIVLEAWSDEHTFYIFNDAQYTPSSGGDALSLEAFSFRGRWPDPKAMIEHFHANGIRVLLWQIPVQKYTEEPHVQREADEAHMLSNGYMIKNADGSPYRNKGWWFTDSLILDATQPAALDWWFAKRAYLFDELGIDGMKTDGGEHLWGRDLVAHNGSRGLELVNRFAQHYIDAYHAFVRHKTGGNGITFSRAGYTGAQRSPAHWAGDENSTWSALKASIQAGLSAGLSGISLWGWDIGGFSGDIPTVELYVRATQMATFCPIMQYHSELHDVSECRDRTPWNIAERFADPRALTIYRAYAQLRMKLLDYIAEEARVLSPQGLPLMRYPFLVWPEAHDTLRRDPHSYLFGRDLLVCPVVEKGAETRDVVLPPGAWLDFWSGAYFEGGGTLVAPAALERIPIFIRADSERADALHAIASTFKVT